MSRNLPTTDPDTISDEKTVDPEYFDDQVSVEFTSPMTESAIMLHDALYELARISAWNHDRLAVAIYRILGMSYAEIGSLLGIRKQAVLLHLSAIGRRNKKVLACLQSRRHMSQAIQQAIKTIPEKHELSLPAAINMPGQSLDTLNNGLDMLRQRRRTMNKMIDKRERILVARISKIKRGPKK